MFKLNFGESPALITEDKIISYNQLADISSSIGNAINKRCHIFLLATNSPDSIAGYIACLNKKIVPIMIDAELDISAIKNLAEIYRPDFLFLPKTLRESFSNCEEIFSTENYLLLATGDKNFYSLNDELALLMTTSGSTGSPKFVRQSYKNILSNTKSIIEYLELDKNSRAITNLPMSYVYGLSVINTHIFSGASIVVTDKTLFQKEFWQLMKDFSVTNFNGVPYTFEMLMRLRFLRMKLPALKIITQAGGKLEIFCNVWSS